MRKNTTDSILLTVIAVLLIVIAVLLVMLLQPGEASGNATEPAPVETTEPAVTDTQEPIYEEEEPQTTGIPLDISYMQLSCPADLENEVSIRYEDLPDGQSIIFTTAFTGEELELFRFSIGKSSAEGHLLGTLSHKQVGELLVYVQVLEYTDGSWSPEDYARLGSLQERVNDIIIQFYEDPRFTPADR